MLSLYRFAQLMGLHPLHFMQVDAPIGSAESRACIEPIFQYPWQNSDGVSRSELREIIDDAEHELADYLGYWPMPRWTADQIVQTDLLNNKYTGLYDARGDRFSVYLPQGGHFISGGRQAKTLIQANSAIVYSDSDSDGYFETATIGPIATTVTDPEEIALYYPNTNAAEEWQIEPITVVISGGMVTITCRREQLVLQSLLESLDAQAVEGMNNDFFLTACDVYRKYNDPSVQVHMVTRGSGCCTEGCESCSISIQTGCITGKDRRIGIVALSPADWDTDDLVFNNVLLCRRPDYVRVWYRSGYRDMGLAEPNINMAHQFELAVARLAISKIDRNICSCRTVADIQARWNTDYRRRASTQAQANSYQLSRHEMENAPFGTTVAGMAVWRFARRHTLALEGVS